MPSISTMKLYAPTWSCGRRLDPARRGYLGSGATCRFFARPRRMNIPKPTKLTCSPLLSVVLVVALILIDDSYVVCHCPHARAQVSHAADQGQRQRATGVCGGEAAAHTREEARKWRVQRCKRQQRDPDGTNAGSRGRRAKGVRQLRTWRCLSTTRRQRSTLQRPSDSHSPSHASAPTSRVPAVRWAIRTSWIRCWQAICSSREERYVESPPPLLPIG